ncbi:hypothetical protein PAPHI01_0177 [Pancytospora philotis]|nr:hypothetical protein PAPHI01_0177 [Pancytospora philotis]
MSADASPVYIYGEAYNGKFSTVGKTYKMEQCAVKCGMCVAQLVADEARVFFAGPVFNSYVLSSCDGTATVQSFDEKRTVVHADLPADTLVALKTVSETADVRTAALYAYDELFPGLVTAGIVEWAGGVAIIKTANAEGEIILQSNVQKAPTECILWRQEGPKCAFVEINNPVDRCSVGIIKSMRNTKIVANGNVRGILKNYKGCATEVEAVVDRVCLGSYIFSLAEGQDNTPAAKRVAEPAAAAGAAPNAAPAAPTGSDARPARSSKKARSEPCEGKSKRVKKADEAEIPAAPEQEQVYEEPAPVQPRRTAGFETIIVHIQQKILDEADIGGNQYRAIDYIRNQAEQGADVLPLFNKYITGLERRDELCLYYMMYLERRGRLSALEFARMLKMAGPAFYKKSAQIFTDQALLQQLYRHRKSKDCFLKLLDLADDKVEFLKSNRDYTDAAIDYVYEHLDEPRVVVESIIDGSFASWRAYLRNESGVYKRGLFRKLVAMGFRKEEMKAVFNLWLEFEEQTGGNVDEVREHARKYEAALIRDKQ